MKLFNLIKAYRDRKLRKFCVKCASHSSAPIIEACRLYEFINPPKHKRKSTT